MAWEVCASVDRGEDLVHEARRVCCVVSLYAHAHPSVAGGRLTIVQEVFEVLDRVRLELQIRRVGTDQGKDVIGEDVGIGIGAGIGGK